MLDKHLFFGGARNVQMNISECQQNHTHFQDSTSHQFSCVFILVAAGSAQTISAPMHRLLCSYGETLHRYPLIR